MLLDCTGTMSSWIQRSQGSLAQNVTNIKDSYTSLEVRAAFIAHRYIGDTNRFSKMPFTDDLNKLIAFMKSKRAEGGRSDCFAEDVQGGFNKALTMVWTPESIKQAFHLFYAPGHGRDICDFYDSHRAGSPDGFKIQH